MGESYVSVWETVAARALSGTVILLGLILVTFTLANSGELQSYSAIFYALGSVLIVIGAATLLLKFTA